MELGDQLMQVIMLKSLILAHFFEDHWHKRTSLSFKLSQLATDIMTLMEKLSGLLSDSGLDTFAGYFDGVVSGKNVVTATALANHAKQAILSLESIFFTRETPFLICRYTVFSRLLFTFAVYCGL